MFSFQGFARDSYLALLLLVAVGLCGEELILMDGATNTPAPNLDGQGSAIRGDDRGAVRGRG